jgi:hypothetical protein
MKTRQTAKHAAMPVLAALALVVVPWSATAGNWTVNNVSDLIAAINAANQARGANTIVLAHPTIFTLTAVNNTTDGPTGLPVIAANHHLTIRGNGATLARSTAPGTPAFRLFHVASGAILTLENLTLANGQVIGDTGQHAYGGAILNAAGASLTVKSSMLVGNQAIGGDGRQKLGGFGFGGAIWNDGTANLDQTTFSGNQAVGGTTRNPSTKTGTGGAAFGGAVLSGNLGTLTVSQCSFTGNKAIGGFLRHPSAWGDAMALGGAIENWGTAGITESTFTENQALGGAADPGVDGGYALAGAIESGSPYALSPVCTIQHCIFSRNQARSGDAGPNNFGGEAVGGALSIGFAQFDAAMTITDCTFTENQAIGGEGGLGGWGEGGVINLESSLPGNMGQSILTIADSTFTDNKAVGGGVGGLGLGGVIGTLDWNAGDGSGATLVISACMFARNEAVAAPGGDSVHTASIAQSGAVDSSGKTTILNSTFMNNRAVGAAAAPYASPGFFTTSCGGALSSWGGNLEIHDTRLIGNQVVGGDASLGGPAGSAMGGAIAVFSGLAASLVNCSLFNNTTMGGSGAPGGAGIGGGLNVGIFPRWAGAASGPTSAVTLTGTTISQNQALGGAGGGQGMGGGYAVGIGVLFGNPDTSSVTLNGGSVVSDNQPDDAFQF